MFSRRRIWLYISLISISLLFAAHIDLLRVEKISITDGSGAWNPSEHPGPRSLEGKWQFVPEGGSPVLLTVPGIWNSIFPDGSGKGSYSCRLYFPEETAGRKMEIGTLNVGTRYRLFINGKQAGSSCASDTGAPEADIRPRVFSFQALPGENLIRFEVKNAVHPKGGLWNKVIIAGQNYLSSRLKRMKALELIMFGSMLFLGLFHLLTHLIYRTEGAVYLFFGLCIICMAMGNAVRSTFPLYDLFPGIPYLLVKRLQFIFYFLAGLFFLQTPVSLQGRAYAIFQRVAGILILLLVGAFIVLPLRQAYGLSFLFYPLMLVFIAIILFDAFDTLHQGKYRAVLNILGLIFLFYGILHDSIDMLTSRYDIQVMPISTWFYALLTTFFLAVDYGRNRAELEETREALLVVSAEERSRLGTDLHDGIGQLTHSLEYISTGFLKNNHFTRQGMEKINAVAKEINHYIRLLIHDFFPVKDDFDFTAAFDELITRFKNVYGRHIEINAALPFSSYDRDRQIHLYYVISEMLKNAHIHSNQGDISLKLLTKKNEIRLQVSNEISEEGLKKIKPGHGTRIMQSRVRILNARLLNEISDGYYIVTLILENK